MHELALAQQTARIVERAAKGKPVKSVELEIGHLRQVVPVAMVSAWEFAVAKTSIEGAQLRIDEIPVELFCETCEKSWPMGSELWFYCDECGARASVERGEEFRVKAIEIGVLR